MCNPDLELPFFFNCELHLTKKIRLIWKYYKEHEYTLFYTNPFRKTVLRLKNTASPGIPPPGTAIRWGKNGRVNEINFFNLFIIFYRSLTFPLQFSDSLT